MCVCVQGSALVPVHVPVPVVWRSRVVPPAPQGGLMSETFLVGDGRGRGTLCHWQIVSTSKKVRKLLLQEQRCYVAGCDTGYAVLAVNHKAAELICT